jgi:hypothetical protein
LIEVLHGESPGRWMMRRGLAAAAPATLIARRARSTPKTLHFRYKSIRARAAAADFGGTLISGL